FAGQSAPSIFGYTILMFFNDPLPWWQGQAEAIYRGAAIAFGGGACVQLVSVVHYATQRTKPHLKRIVLPVAGGR
ncbi:MAG: hypothetical protein AAFO77_12400, partial [Pseudomonadota bacterium]